MADSNPSPPKAAKPWFFFQLVEAWEYRYGGMKDCNYYVVAARSSEEAEKFAKDRLNPEWVGARRDIWRVPDQLADRFHAQWPNFVGTELLRSIGETLEQSDDGTKGIYLLGGDWPLKFGVHLDPGKQPPRPLQQWEIDQQETWRKIKPYAVGLVVAFACAFWLWSNLPPK